MDPLQELRDLSTPRKGPPCALTHVDLSGDDLAAFQSGLVDPAITSKAISSFLHKRGININFWTIGRHRRGECGCSK
jgi:hypothetical protein